MKFQKIISFYPKLLFAAIVILSAVCSCSDDVDESNLYAFKSQMISGYLQSNPEFSNYCDLLRRVKLNKKASTSVLDMLSTRGNYTCFAPTNEEVQAYVDSLMETPNYPLSELNDSIVSLIVKNSIINNKDESAYTTAMFSIGTLTYQNMNERYVTIDIDTLNGKASYIINSTSRISTPDIELGNGVLHVMNHVVSASMAFLPSLMESASNLHIFSRLIRETGWDKEMEQYLDADYEEDHPETGKPTWPQKGESNRPCPEHRKQGFTAFVEPDSIFEQKWGIKIQLSEQGTISNWNEIKRIIEEKCNGMSIYKSQSEANGSPTAWTDPNNVVNQFVAYHIIPQSMTSSILVCHWSELGFSYKSPERLTLNVTENYITIGNERRLLRITEGAVTEGKRINRYSTYNADTYDEETVTDKGLLISVTNGKENNNALNGFYYPIDDILEYSEHTRDDILNDRLRFDVQAIVPEASSNGFRDPQEAFYYSIPSNYLKSTFSHISNESWITAKNEMGAGGGPQGWRDYFSSVIQFLGQYDFTMLLPPVPYTGTYEFRWGLSNNESRSMAQLYFGTDPDNLPAIGVPLDMRLIASSPAIGWKQDGTDWDLNYENDRVMRTHGYMKGPKLYGQASAGGTTTNVRNYGGSGQTCFRYIVYRGKLEAGKKYYMRAKSVLSNEYAQFHIDYLELVPKSIWGGTKAEDIW